LNGKQTVLRKGEMLTEVDVSPDGRYLLLDILQKPFSYLVQLIASVQYHRDRSDGKVVKAIHERPLLETMPKGFNGTGQTPHRLACRQTGDA
jgi:hypothetical protein